MSIKQLVTIRKVMRALLVLPIIFILMCPQLSLATSRKTEKSDSKTVYNVAGFKIEVNRSKKKISVLKVPPSSSFRKSELVVYLNKQMGHHGKGYNKIGITDIQQFVQSFEVFKANEKKSEGSTSSKKNRIRR